MWRMSLHSLGEQGEGEVLDGSAFIRSKYSGRGKSLGTARAHCASGCWGLGHDETKINRPCTIQALLNIYIVKPICHFSKKCYLRNSVCVCNKMRWGDGNKKSCLYFILQCKTEENMKNIICDHECFHFL